MKRILISLLVWMAVCMTAAAGDVIVPGTHYFDGSMHFEAEQRYGRICLVGTDAHGQVCELLLDNYGEDDVPGMYMLSPTSVTHNSPYGVEWGARVVCAQVNGNQVIEVLVDGDTCVLVAATLVQTAATPDECLDAQRWAEQQPLADLAKGWVMNCDLVNIWDTSELVKQARAMEGKSLTEVERLNYLLIQNEITQRWRHSLALHDVDDGDPDAEAVDPQPLGGVLANLPRYTVHNVEEFIRALGSDREIIIEKGVEINLSRVLDNFDFFSSPGFKMHKYLVATKFVGEEHGPIVMSEFCSDGSQLSLINIHNLYIHGRRGAKIVVEPRRAYVFNLVGCDNVCLSNLIMGHTEGGYCEGGVVGVELSSNISITDCDLYGCGTYGLTCNKSEAVYMRGSNIHDCTYGIMELRHSHEITFEECDFFRNREYDLVDVFGCDEVLFTDCRFYLNNRTSMVFASSTPINVENCVIYHPADHIGDPEMVRQLNCWQLEGDEYGPPTRGCGPK